VLAQLDGVHWLVANLLYGSGLRVLEALRLRVKDIDLKFQADHGARRKRRKDRVTVLPTTLVQPLTAHLARTKERHLLAVEGGFGGVQLPFALARKYPRAEFDWAWQYVFPSTNVTVMIHAPDTTGAIMCSKRTCSARCARRRGHQDVRLRS
jgi:integrase